MRNAGSYEEVRTGEVFSCWIERPMREIGQVLKGKERKRRGQCGLGEIVRSRRSQGEEKTGVVDRDNTSKVETSEVRTTRLPRLTSGALSPLWEGGWWWLATCSPGKVR